MQCSALVPGTSRNSDAILSNIPCQCLLLDFFRDNSLGERAVVDGFTAIRRGAVADELIHDREVRAPVVYIPREEQGRRLSAGRTHRRGAR